MSLKVFISHRNRDLSNAIAGALHSKFKNLGFDPFFDKVDLRGGDTWDEKLITRVQTSDVLILLIEKETDSTWVQREVDTARGINVQILPLVVSTEDYDAIQEVLKKLNLDKVQYIEYDPTLSDGYIQEVVSLIYSLGEKTQQTQRAWIRERERQNKIDFVHDNNKRAASFTLPRIDNCEFVIATGDATQLKGYDVLVNSENTYMQMARFYEADTLSRAVRYKGAYVTGGRLIEDSIQEQLYRQIKADVHQSLPIVRGHVIATEAGHKDCELRKWSDYRYVFHAAAVDFDLEFREIIPISDHEIQEVIENCYNIIQTIDSTHGEMFLDTDGNITSVEDYEPIKSIVFPIFGTGHAKGGYLEAVKSILMGFKKYTKKYIGAGLQLERVGICIYNHNDLMMIEQLMKELDFKS